MSPEPDLLIVGGGPAGLATALAARRLGLSATVLDRGAPGRDKACGEGLMPDGVAALARLGVGAERLGGRPFTGIHYLDVGLDVGLDMGLDEGLDAGLGADRDREPEAAGIEVAADFPGPPGLGIRRTRLHAALAGEAAAAGVELLWGVKATGLVAEGGRFAVAGPGGPWRGRWIAGADGLGSAVRRWAGLEGRPGAHRRFGVRRHFRLRPWSRRVEVWWAGGCEAYVTPVADDEVGVAFLWGDPGTGPATDRIRGFDDLLARVPRLAGRLAGAPAVSRDRGAGPLHRRARAVAAGNLALVGDAGGYLDAITGEGLALAFQQAEALAAAVAAGGGLAPYAAAHRRLARLPEALTALLLFVERRPALRRRLLRALAAEPALFTRLLGVHSRSLPLSGFGLDGALRLARRLAFG